MTAAREHIVPGRVRRVHVLVEGVVQGVGFRPFVYRHATRLGLAGHVVNSTGCVEVEAEGDDAPIQDLIGKLREGSPNARVERLTVKEQPATGQSTFSVVESVDPARGTGTISPDAAVCDRCLEEMDDSTDHRHDHLFINCTDCGPRFSIIEALPYDRARTSMSEFEMCPRCRREYDDPADRRFHAEATACPECGPTVRLVSFSGSILATSMDAVEQALEMLREGRILAIKGIGGFHLACDATREDVVDRLRRLKRRPDRPLAVMCRDAAVARQYCRMSGQEERLLCSPARPIVILERKPVPGAGGPPIATAVAPLHRTIGVMLPYTPLHHRLLQPGRPPWLVMTSGNRTGEPICTDVVEAMSALGEIADAYLDHDRRIVNRCDDSVAMVSRGKTVLTRRSRGFVPLPVVLDRDVEPTLALGAMLSNAIAVARGRRATFSQHIGDVDNQATLSFLREMIDRLCRLARVEPGIVAHDLHPELESTYLAHELSEGRTRVAVQHHHAHLAAAMAAEGITEDVQGLVLDGTGYGTDGRIWGCEILVGSAAGCERAGHLRPLPLAGGEAAIRRPLRTAVAYLRALVPEASGTSLDLWSRALPAEIETVHRLVDGGFNAPMTTSAGRLFDAVSSLLGACDTMTYEGQAAIELEQLAGRCRKSEAARLHMDITFSGERIVLDPAGLMADLVAGILHGEYRARLAAGFHKALASALARACASIHDRGGPRTVVLCGGVFQNRILTRLTDIALREAGLHPVTPGHVPVNDGGLALGQILVAHEVVHGRPPRAGG
jgi:hydrogenase maturation protein HypF